MKNSYKVALLAALGLVAATAANAQVNNGDLVIGFESSSGDYVVDVGQISALTANDVLSSQFSASSITALGSSLTVGAVGGDANNDIIWESITRTTQPVTSYTTQGSTTPQRVSAGNIDDASGMPSSLTTGSTALTLQPSGISWGDTISGRSGALTDTFHSDMAWSPSLLSSGAVNLDLYTANDPNNTFTYVGDLEINVSGSSPTVIWDPSVAVPEPTTYGLLAGFGLLVLSLRNQFSRKNA